MLHIRFGASILTAITLMLTPASAEKRVALIVGNTHYEHSPALTNPANDAEDVAGVLRSLGFEVLLGLDLDKRAFDLKVRDFALALSQADTALFFYAGHGLQVSLQNYLVPVDAKIARSGPRLRGCPARFHPEADGTRTRGQDNIVFLDACRDNPFTETLARTMGTRAISIGRGLAEVQTGVGTFIAYSTQPGNVASDGSGRNSPFAAALKRHLQSPLAISPTS